MRACLLFQEKRTLGSEREEGVSQEKTEFAHGKFIAERSSSAALVICNVCWQFINNGNVSVKLIVTRERIAFGNLLKQNNPIRNEREDNCLMERS